MHAVCVLVETAVIAKSRLVIESEVDQPKDDVVVCVARRLKNLHRQSNAMAVNETSFLSESLLDGVFQLLFVIINFKWSISFHFVVYTVV